MKTNRLLTLTLSFMLFISSVFAQNGKFEAPRFVNNLESELNKHIETSTTNGWLFFKKNTLVPPQSYFSTYGQEYGLGGNDEMKLVKSETDELGMSHFRFVQYHHGVEVEGSDYSLHYKEKNLVSAHGAVIENFSLSQQGTINYADALKAALKAVGAAKYVWEDPLIEQQLKADTKNPNATFLPTGEKIYTKKYNDGFTATVYRLAWRFRIKSLAPSNLLDVYVDTRTNEVIK